MKYALLYPEASFDVEPAKGLARVDCLVDCFCCGEQTQFVDMALRAGICSEECAHELLIKRGEKPWPDFASELPDLQNRGWAA